jgi:hypothetical protein
LRKVESTSSCSFARGPADAASADQTTWAALYAYSGAGNEFLIARTLIDKLFMKGVRRHHEHTVECILLTRMVPGLTNLLGREFNPPAFAAASLLSKSSGVRYQTMGEAVLVYARMSVATSEKVR